METLKANELRIGNLVEYQINDTITDRKPYYGKNIYTVAIILDDSIKINLGFGALQRVMFEDPKLKPVPLAHNWMERLDYKAIEENSAGTIYNIIILGEFINEDLNIVYFARSERAGKFFRRRLEIKYVHQLQNLHFALTGEELTQ